mgnify:CR=1 FL=1
MNSKEIRSSFLNFFRDKNHKIIPSVSLISPDPSVLFTTAGMQPLSPYLAGKKDPLKDFGTRHLASCQKCFRTNDIDEVGDNTHHTFFEMLGNWSIGVDEKGNYFKEGAIQLALEFLIKKLKLNLERISITFFKGDETVPEDKETFLLWQKYGISKERIRPMGKSDNFWGPVGKEGPCGPCSEIYYLKENGQEVEIWNLVFMEYYQKEDGGLEKLSQTNIDTGIGFERLVAVLQNKESSFETDLFEFLIPHLESNSQKRYQDYKREFRIIMDHLRALTFLIGDGVLPSNLGQGYILRRIFRRAMRYFFLLNVPTKNIPFLISLIIENYGDIWPEIKEKKEFILRVVEQEEEKFSRVLKRGMELILKEIDNLKRKSERIMPGKVVFDFYQNYGFPFELTQEIARENDLLVSREEFEQYFRKHQEISRKSMEKKFGGHGFKEEKELDDKDKTEKIKRLHTATHLLHAALRQILGENVFQQGSDITPERLRFDFSFSRKLTPEELKNIEDLVNQKIKEGLIVKKEKKKLKDALEEGALAFFKERYPPEVYVYTIGDFSKEICAGPHVEKTSELGHFKIVKEEAVSANVRRIRAILE